jgi:hypothetical protein
MKRNNGILALIIMAVLLISLPAAVYAESDNVPPKLTATLSEDTLIITATDDLSGIAAVYVDGHRINDISDGKAQVNLRDYAGNAPKVTVYAVDGAGNRSKEVMIDNPYYTQPVPLSPDGTAPSEDSPQTQESAEADGQTGEAADTASGAETSASPAAFTPDGTGTVLDSATDEDGKEFYTITTEAGNIFYLIIDRQRTDGGVYFLNAVTEEDLAALAKKADEDGGIGPSFGEPEQAEQEEPSPAPTSEPDPEPEQEPERNGGASAGSVIFVILIAAVIGGAAYYVKVMRPKKLAEAEMAGDDEWEDFFGDDEDSAVYEDEEPAPYDGADPPDETLYDDMDGAAPDHDDE